VPRVRPKAHDPSALSKFLVQDSVTGKLNGELGSCATDLNQTDTAGDHLLM